MLRSRCHRSSSTPDMADPTPPSASPRVSTEIPRLPPRWGFFKGLLTGAVIEVPILASAVWVLEECGVGDSSTSFRQLLRLAAMFAGIASVLTAAGLGRLAAHASVDGGRPRAAYVAARAHAFASIGLVIIAAIPNGVPATHVGWLSYVLAGLISGALAGSIIGAVCGSAVPVSISDVLSLARKPTDALRHVLDPVDLGKVTTRLRTRTAHLFDGMFDPSPKAPPTPDKDEKKQE